MDITITCNTPDDVLFANVRQNSELPLEWVTSKPEHDGHAVIVGGGPSLADTLDMIRWRKSLGQTVFALNNAARFLLDNGITPDFQVILDARQENAQFVCDVPLLAGSQCHPDVFKASTKAILWHPVIEGIEEYIDKDCELIGGGTTVGLSTMCLVYALGYRKMHLFGYDSSYRMGESHAYEQALNKGEALAETVFEGVKYFSSLTMARQAELFPQMCNNLLDAGCTITVDGDGLIPAIAKSMARTPDIEEQDKYTQMWNLPQYRDCSPGESVAQTFLDIAKPDGVVLDLGCGTGRGGLAISRKFELVIDGREAVVKHCPVVLIDFTENSRDPEARKLPFIKCDLSKVIHIQGDYGFCTDVLEHIPPEQMDAVLTNLSKCVPKLFLQISLVPDTMGALIGQPLHLSVHPFDWWVETLSRFGVITWSQDQGESALFYLSTT